MPKPGDFLDRYETGNTPWDTGRPDVNLTAMVETWPIQTETALEVGCGYGHNALWLAEHGFQVTGVDLSSIAIEQARRNALEAKLDCAFYVADFLTAGIPGGPFGFAFDRGCFHTCEAPAGLQTYAKKVSDHLTPRGLWLTLAGSADDPPRDHGPPRISARSLTAAVEPFFELLSLKGGHFDSIRAKPPRAWICLMRKR